LHGILAKIRDLGLQLISVVCVDCAEASETMKRGNFMNTEQQITNTKTIPRVKGRTLLLALGYGIGIGASLGVLTGFGLPLIVPALSSIEWLATIIATECTFHSLLVILLLLADLAHAPETSARAYVVA